MAVPFMFFCKEMMMLRIWNGSVEFGGSLGGLGDWKGGWEVSNGLDAPEVDYLEDRFSSKMDSESEYSVVEWEDSSRGEFESIETVISYYSNILNDRNLSLLQSTYATTMQKL
jgi:hypothetical protein